MICLFGAARLIAQPAPKVRYWIQFKNKTGTPYALNNPSAFLSAPSIARRTAYNIPYHFSDLPVTPSYLQQIDNVNHVDLLYASKWLNGAVVAIDSSAVALAALSAIKSFSFVLDTLKVKKIKLNKLPEVNAIDNAAKGSGSSDALSSVKYGKGTWQAYQLEVQCLHDRGYKGQGMTIAVCDVGFNDVNTGVLFDSIRKSGGIIGTRDFVAGGTNAYQGGDHGTMVFSCMAANVPGLLVGTAPKAKYWLLRTEDGSSETLTEEYNWIRGAEFADSVGADIITTSLGYTTFDNPIQNHTYQTLNGRKAPMSIAATMAARKGMFLLNAAGNEGNSNWKYIGVPADADSICTVGAVDTTGALASFSSVGPTFDGRTKPDLLACGWNCYVSNDGVQVFPGSGTSFATPVLAGAIACYWQACKSYNNMHLMDTLKKMASNAATPNNTRGWGIPKLCNGITSINKIEPDTEFDFNVYANPNNNQITVNLNRTNFDKLSICIFDAAGKIVFNNEYSSIDYKMLLNTVGLTSGVYLIQVQTSKGQKNKKLLKL
ncbi:MAG: S8 family serine peptidase [Bacteroidota bacterium]